ncbi:uncharacterized protein LOC111060193 isoform X2 [Nilaparvata lugens]|uniref:uncharacterized protein LOC111060193 isoform X2 n=1 Tax=Nilaparvata lugens TaxID=108931 RepID=UPI00193CA4CB|nr:uncharacterized protein LOC111060193 isoform X2 [Nilaparvata lugens]
MDLDFSFTLRTSIKPTVQKKLTTNPASGQSKRILSSTRRKHCQGLFVNNDIDTQPTESRSENYVADKKSTTRKNRSNNFSVEVKENLDPSGFVMNTDDKLPNHRQSLSSKSELDSSGEKDFIELGKVSLRKHQRSLYKRNIKDGKLFYKKKNVLANFTEYIEKSFTSNNNCSDRQLSDEVIENGLRVSERLQIDRSALSALDDGDDDDNLFGSSMNCRVEMKNGLKSGLDRSLTEGNESLIVSSPSLLSSSLLGCRPLSNEKKRPRDTLDDSSPCNGSKHKKRSLTMISNKSSSFKTSGTNSFEILKAKVKSIMSSSGSTCEEDSSLLSPKVTSPSTSFIDCISASDSDEQDCSHNKLASKLENSVDDRRKSSVKNLINGMNCSNSSVRRKSLRNRCNDIGLNGDDSTINYKFKFDINGTNGHDHSRDVSSRDKDENNPSFRRQNFDFCNVKSRRSCRNVDESCTSVDIFDNSRLSEVVNDQISDKVEDKSKSRRRRRSVRKNSSREDDNGISLENSTKVERDRRNGDIWVGKSLENSTTVEKDCRKGDARISLENSTTVRKDRRNGDIGVGISLENSKTVEKDRRIGEVRISLENSSTVGKDRRKGDIGVGISLENSTTSKKDRRKDVATSLQNSKKVSNGVEDCGKVRIKSDKSRDSISSRIGRTKYVDCVNSSGYLLGFRGVNSVDCVNNRGNLLGGRSSSDSEKKVTDKLSDDSLLKESKSKTSSSDSSLLDKNRSKTSSDHFTRPKTPRRKSFRLSGVIHLRKDESCVSRDMFESDVEDEKQNSRLDVEEIEIRKSDHVHRSISESVKLRKDRTSLSPEKIRSGKPPKKENREEKPLKKNANCEEQNSSSPNVHYNISEIVKTRKDRKSLSPVKSPPFKPARKSRENPDCDPGYVTPSLPRTKLLEITKWLTDSEKSIRHHGPTSSKTKMAEPPLLEEEPIVVSDSCSEDVNVLKTPPKTKTDRHRANKTATDKEKTRNRTKTDKRSKKGKEEPLDKDEVPFNGFETISSKESKEDDGKQRTGVANIANIGMYTEPKKTRKKKTEMVQPSFTEKKPTKTSMFSSSSSSEDLFEKFLEDEKKKRLSRQKRLERFEKLSVDRFIYDGSSEEEDTSMAFYNDFIGSEVKKDVECLSEGKWSIKSGESDRHRARSGGVVHPHPRRLSFESQGSQSGSDRAAIRKPKKPHTKPKKRTPDKISKKHLPFRISPKHFLGGSKTKKSAKKGNSVKKSHEDKVIEQIKRINDNKKLVPTTPSTDSTKSSTKKVIKIQLTSQKPTGDSATPSSAKLRKELFSKTPAKTLSFLSSLSVLDDGDRCHPDAAQYKKSFKKLKEELAKKLFALYNREVFQNRLPEDFPIEWNSRMRSTSGYCFNKRTIRGGEITRSARIQLSSKILDAPDRLRDTLIHEMCHAATWLLDGVKDAHGPTWKNWTLQAMRRFPELPRITVCHDYKIKTKYSYKCLGCGYSVGRHSKSLDIEHKRCGYCYGKFELLVNVRETTDKDRKTGTRKRPGNDKESDTATTSTSTTRAVRAPTGFALFVKENYAKVRQENDKLAHKDVMKVLSERFAKFKVTKPVDVDDDVIFVES